MIPLANSDVAECFLGCIRRLQGFKHRVVSLMLVYLGLDVLAVDFESCRDFVGLECLAI